MPLQLESLLLKEEIISKSRLEEAVTLSHRKGTTLLETLLTVGYLGEKDAAQLFNRRLGLPWFTLKSGKLRPITDQNLEEMVTYDFALKNIVLPLFRSLNSLCLVMADPLNMEIIYNLEKMVGCKIRPVVATRSDILKAIDIFYKSR